MQKRIFLYFRLGPRCQFKFSSLVGFTLDNTYGTYVAATIAVGDFNNDRQSDIIFTRSNRKYIGILMANNEEFFTESMIFSSVENNEPHLVVVDNFNQDDHLDIVVAYRLSDNIDIFLGRGNGTFRSRIIFPVGNNLNSIALGDFNLDGQSDLAVLNTTHIAVLLSNGNGSFRIYASISTEECSNLLVGDFNNDSKLDLAASSYSQQELRVFFGNNDGNFHGPITTSADANTRPYLMTVRDFNHDGLSDLAIINSGTSTVAIRLGNTNGTFRTQTTYSTGLYSEPGSIVIGDFNNDNQSDVAVANSNTYDVSIFPGVGDGTFLQQINIPLGYGFPPGLISAGDFNGDGKLDLCISVGNSNALLFLLNSSDFC